MKAVVFTLGCKVNEYESDSIIAELESRGYEVSDKLEYADVYVVNTCAVTAEAEKKSRQTASRILKFNPNAKIIYTGCASEKCPKAFSEKNGNFLVTGTFGKNKIADMLDCSGEKVFNQTSEYEELFPAKSLRTRSYIKVQDGCDNFCSYCIIPYLRGRNRSRSPESILSELNKESVKEAVITGINLSAYNFNGEGLSDLIGRLKDVKTRIRLGSLEVRVIDEKLLSALKSLKDFAPHFHLSLQSGSDAVLKTMNRHYTGKEYLTKCELIRSFFPDCAITTDIIVGFPTETEENFSETLALVDKVKFADIHAFPFSPRSGTVAFKMKDLPPEVKKRRLNELLEKKAFCKCEFAKREYGKILEFLPEDTENGFTVGYTGNYLKVYVKGVKTDKICKVKIGDPYLEGALAEIIEKE